MDLLFKHIKKFIFLVSIFSTNLFYSQVNIKTVRNEINTLFEQKKDYLAIKLMEKLILEHDTIKDYASIKTRIGIAFQSIDSIESSRKWYLSVINDTLISDSKEDYWLGEMETRGNYKHISCYNMALSYYEEGNYEKSIEYYKLALNKFQYYHFSGSDINKNKVTISKNIADLYSKKGDLTTAFSYLLPFFENSIVYSNRAINKSARILKEHNLEKDFFELMNKDFNSIIENEKIVLNLSNKKIILIDFTSQGLSKDYINEKAKYFWNNVLVRIKEEIQK